MHDSLINAFIWHYTAAGLQLCDEDLGPDAEREQFAPETVAKIEADCRRFLGLPGVGAALGDQLYEYEQAGTDFWLTRNGHGSGFWDRPEVYGEAEAERLTEASKGFPEVDFYRGDDQLIYQ